VLMDNIFVGADLGVCPLCLPIPRGTHKSYIVRLSTFRIPTRRATLYLFKSYTVIIALAQLPMVARGGGVWPYKAT